MGAEVVLAVLVDVDVEVESERLYMELGRAGLGPDAVEDDIVDSLDRVLGVVGVGVWLALLLLRLVLVRVDVLSEGRDEGVDIPLVLCTRMWERPPLKLLGGSIFEDCGSLDLATDLVLDVGSLFGACEMDLEDVSGLRSGGGVDFACSRTDCDLPTPMFGLDVVEGRCDDSGLAPVEPLRRPATGILTWVLRPASRDEADCVISS